MNERIAGYPQLQNQSYSIIWMPSRIHEVNLPFGRWWGTFSTRWTSGIGVPWRPPCSKSTWRYGRTCWADRRRLNDRREWSEHRTTRSSAWYRGGRRAAARCAPLSYAARRRTARPTRQSNRHNGTVNVSSVINITVKWLRNKCVTVSKNSVNLEK